MLESEGRDDHTLWTPRLSRAFKDYLRAATDANHKRLWGDRTINRVLSHSKTFAKWMHKLRPFPLGNPTAKLKLVPVGRYHHKGGNGGEFHDPFPDGHHDMPGVDGMIVKQMELFRVLPIIAIMGSHLT